MPEKKYFPSNFIIPFQPEKFSKWLYLKGLTEQKQRRSSVLYEHICNIYSLYYCRKEGLYYTYIGILVLEMGQT